MQEEVTQKTIALYVKVGKGAARLDQVAAGFPPGFSAWVRVADRRAAIRQALAMGRAGDVILLAGKGHETYQEVGEARLPLDEREEIASFFRESTL